MAQARKTSCNQSHLGRKRQLLKGASYGMQFECCILYVPYSNYIVQQKYLSCNTEDVRISGVLPLVLYYNITGVAIIPNPLLSKKRIHRAILFYFPFSAYALKEVQSRKKGIARLSLTLRGTSPSSLKCSSLCGRNVAPVGSLLQPICRREW